MPWYPPPSKKLKRAALAPAALAPPCSPGGDLPAAAAELPKPRKTCLDAQQCASGAKPTLRQVFADIFDSGKDVNRNEEWLDYFECHLQREYSCRSESGADDCEYGEGSLSFCDTHSVAHGLDGIGMFLGYFVPRKMCTPDMRDMKRCCATLRTLVSHCKKKGYIDSKKQRELNAKIKVSESFDANGISSALQRLTDERWWDTLTGGNGGVNGGGEDEGDFKLLENSEMRGGLSVSVVSSEGWEFEERTLLRLPPDVAKMGKVGMNISCMDLIEKNGVVRPYGAYEGFRMVCANVYPPRVPA